MQMSENNRSIQMSLILWQHSPKPYKLLKYFSVIHHASTSWKELIPKSLFAHFQEYHRNRGGHCHKITHICMDL